ncbi:hypothetical protein AGOR_G00003060 [Albula goreensis]|uniref:C2H2-type domain-containing protein n=1 Tax=Albula goreensis TaxID=1534307 RepID=A0A8T3E4R4_9TELE|nr:hypothetical protein AGOR_G00003060 [Albula goreensis]
MVRCQMHCPLRPVCPVLCDSPVGSLQQNALHLQQHENAVEGDACCYHCSLCNYSTKAKLNLIQHVRSMKHQRSESLRKLQRLQKGLPEEEEELSAIFTIRKCPSAETGKSGETARPICMLSLAK